MSEEKKKYTTEWSFSFDKIADEIQNAFKGEPGELKHQQFVEPLNGATSAGIRIDLSINESFIYALPEDDDRLIVADLMYYGDIDFSTTGDAERQTRLREMNSGGKFLRHFKDNSKLSWKIGIHPSVPVNLEIHAGVGRVNLDLKTISLYDLKLECGAGSIELHLPAQFQSLKYNGGVGKTFITIPDYATGALNLGIGVGKLEAEIGAQANLDLHIDGGVGPCDIHLSQDNAYQLHATTGIGSIKTDSRGKKVGDNEWRTHDYESASRRVNMRYNGGVGSFKLK